MTAIDIAVIGAGPAGAWAAYRLAEAGARVHVFDASHPREKACGGGVTGRALAIVARALPVEALPAIAIESAVFERDDTSARVPLAVAGVAPETSLIVVDRCSFDAALLAAAGRAGAILVPSRVLDLRPDHRGIEIATAAGSYRADIVLGADGANSLVRRRLFRPFTRSQLSIATGYFAHGLSAREIVVRFEADPPGYLWAFPRANHLAIGICAQADQAHAGALRTRVAAWIRGAGVAAGARLEPYSWPIPSLSSADLDAERPAADRWLLLGDAAGLVDSITREGIFFALQSAEAAADALREPRRSAREYSARLGDEIYPELARAARLKAGFFRPPFTRLLVAALAESPAVRGIMADLVAGRQPYASLKRRLLATFKIGLAWRLLMLELGH